jgi:hypothetical protein
LVSGLLASMFGVSALGKIDGWNLWSGSVYRLFGRAMLARTVKIGLPLAEVIGAVALIVRPASGLQIAAVLLGALGLGVLVLRSSHTGADCGCFGSFGAAGRIDVPLAARNLVLALLAAGFAYVSSHHDGDRPITSAGLLALMVATSIVLLMREGHSLVSLRPMGRQEGTGAG